MMTLAIAVYLHYNSCHVLWGNVFYHGFTICQQSKVCNKKGSLIVHAYHQSSLFLRKRKKKSLIVYCLCIFNNNCNAIWTLSIEQYKMHFIIIMSINIEFRLFQTIFLNTLIVFAHFSYLQILSMHMLSCNSRYSAIDSFIFNHCIIELERTFTNGRDCTNRCAHFNWRVISNVIRHTNSHGVRRNNTPH